MLFRSGRRAPLARIRQMSGQMSRGSAGEYQADERAGVAPFTGICVILEELLSEISLDLHEFSSSFLSQLHLDLRLY